MLINRIIGIQTVLQAAEPIFLLEQFLQAAFGYC